MNYSIVILLQHTVPAQFGLSHSNSLGTNNNEQCQHLKHKYIQLLPTKYVLTLLHINRNPTILLLRAISFGFTMQLTNYY